MASNSIPENFLCPITQQIMAEPVVAADGYTYEREQIEEWFLTHDTSPKTNEPLTDKTVRPNHNQRSDIITFLERNPELYHGDELYLPKSWKEQTVKAIKTKKIDDLQQLLNKDKRLLKVQLEDAQGFDLSLVTCSSIDILSETVKRDAISKKTPILIRENDKFHIFGCPEEVEEWQLTPLQPSSPEVTIQLNSLAYGTTIKLGDNKILVDAIKTGHTHLTTALELACKDSSAELVSLLIKKLMPDNKISETDNFASLNLEKTYLNLLLEQHLRSKDYNFCELLLELGADVEQPQPNKNSLLHRIVQSSNQEATNWLLEHKANLESTNLTLQTPLILATHFRLEPMVNLLLGKSANTEAKNNQQQTSLYLAVNLRQINIARALLAKNARVTDTFIPDNKTLLHIAAQNNDLPMLQLLMMYPEAAKLIDVPDAKGNTPLHAAADSGANLVIPFLLEKTSYPKIKNAANQTALALAEAKPALKPTAKLISEKIQTLKRDKWDRLEKATQLIDEQKAQIATLQQILATKYEEDARRDDLERLKRGLTDQGKKTAALDQKFTELLKHNSVWAESKSEPAEPVEEASSYSVDFGSYLGIKKG